MEIRTEADCTERQRFRQMCLAGNSILSTSLLQHHYRTKPLDFTVRDVGLDFRFDCLRNQPTDIRPASEMHPVLTPARDRRTSTQEHTPTYTQHTTIQTQHTSLHTQPTSTAARVQPSKCQPGLPLASGDASDVFMETSPGRLLCGCHALDNSLNNHLRCYRLECSPEPALPMDRTVLTGPAHLAYTFRGFYLLTHDATIAHTTHDQIPEPNFGGLAGARLEECTMPTHVFDVETLCDLGDYLFHVVLQLVDWWPQGKQPPLHIMPIFKCESALDDAKILTATQIMAALSDKCMPVSQMMTNDPKWRRTVLGTMLRSTHNPALRINGILPSTKQATNAAQSKSVRFVHQVAMSSGIPEDVWIPHRKQKVQKSNKHVTDTIGKMRRLRQEYISDRESVPGKLTLECGTGTDELICTGLRSDVCELALLVPGIHQRLRRRKYSRILRQRLNLTHLSIASLERPLAHPSCMERMVCGTTPQHVYNTATNTCRRMPQPLAHMHTKTHAHTHAQIQHTHKHMHTPTQEHAHIQAHTHAHTPSVAQPQRKRSGCDPNTITAQLKTIHQNDTTPQQTATHRETDASQETRVHTNQAHTHTAQRQQTQTHTHNLHQPQPSAHPAEAHTYSHTYTRTHTHTLAHTRTHTPRIAASLNTDRPRTSPTASVDVCDCVGDNSELTVTGSALLLFIVKRDVWFKLRRCCDEKRLRRHVDTLLDTPFLARACRRLVGSDWYMGPVAYWQCAALQDRILADTLQAIVGLLFQSCDINQCARVFAEWCLVDEEELRVLFISPSQRVECIDRTKGIDNRVSELAENLGFKRSELLDLALKQDGAHHVDRTTSHLQFAFVGRPTLDLLFITYLRQAHAQLNAKGLLTLSDIILGDDHLAWVATQMQLKTGHTHQSGRNSERIKRSNQLRAVVGALFVDSGLSMVARFLERHLYPTMDPERLLEGGQPHRDYTWVRLYCLCTTQYANCEPVFRVKQQARPMRQSSKTNLKGTKRMHESPTAQGMTSPYGREETNGRTHSAQTQKRARPVGVGDRGSGSVHDHANAVEVQGGAEVAENYDTRAKHSPQHSPQATQQLHRHGTTHRVCSEDNNEASVCAPDVPLGSRDAKEYTVEVVLLDHVVASATAGSRVETDALAAYNARQALRIAYENHATIEAVHHSEQA